MKVYILIEENSPELQADGNGAYEIKAVYYDYKKACKAALGLAESYNEADNYEIVDTFNEYPREEKMSYTLYLNGNEDSNCWFNIIVKPKEIIQ